MITKRLPLNEDELELVRLHDQSKELENKLLEYNPDDVSLARMKIGLYENHERVDEPTKDYQKFYSSYITQLIKNLKQYE